MSSTCDSAMAPWPWTVAMASLGRHHEASRPAWESHVVPQTVAISTCMSTSMGVRIWHIKGILTCHQCATLRWHLPHGLWLWHHWVGTASSLDRRGIRMLFLKRWPLPLACRHQWVYRFGTSRAILTCHHRATLRWPLPHGLRLWHHWVGTTSSLNRCVSRTLFPKRWPLPLACRHQWEYGFGTSRAS